MKIRIAIMSAALAVVGFSACGDDTSGIDGGTAYAVSAGDYNVTNAQATTDSCNLLEGYQAAGKQVHVTDTNGVFGFDFGYYANDPVGPSDAKTIATAVLDGNTFGQAVAANYTAAFDDGCVLNIQRTVTGDLVADNTASLTLTASIAPDVTSQADCSGDSPSGTDTECNSTITFTATLAQ